KPGARDCRLSLVEPRVHAVLRMPVLVGLAAVAEPPQTRRDLRIARRDGAAVAERAEVFRRIEAVGGGGAERSDRTSAARRAVRLAAVLDHEESMAVRDLRDGAHV